MSEEKTNWQTKLHDLQSKAKALVSEEHLAELKHKASESAEGLEAKAQEALHEVEEKLAEIKAKAASLVNEENVAKLKDEAKEEFEDLREDAEEVIAKAKVKAAEVAAEAEEALEKAKATISSWFK